MITMTNSKTGEAVKWIGIQIGGRLTLRLPAATLDLLAVLAHERGVTRSELLAELIESASKTKTTR